MMGTGDGTGVDGTSGEQPSEQPGENRTLEWALFYIRLGWGLCALHPHSKRPMGDKWNTFGEYITTEERARQIWGPDPNRGIGIIHAASGTGTLDIDHLEHTRAVLEAFGFDLDELLNSCPRIIGREGRAKIIFRLPPGHALTTKKLIWLKPPGEAKSPRDFFTLFELRTGDMQDVLPPSIHPDTRQEFAWVEKRAPWDFEAIPECPPVLLHIWQSFDSFKRQFQAECPWWKGEEPIQPKPARPRAPGSQSVIAAFNEAHDIRAFLEAHGYRRKGKRYLAPSSSTKIPGVNIMQDGRVYSHHASDILNDGHAHDAFDLYCLFEHGGNVGEAVKAAGRMLGLSVPGNLVPGYLQPFEPEYETFTSEAFEIQLSPALEAQRAALRGEALPAEGQAGAEPQSATEGQTEAQGPEEDGDEDDDEPEGQAEPPSDSPAGIPEHVLNPGGLIGAICDWINSTAIKRQPALALANTVAALGALFGRRYETETGLRTNYYFIGLAESGDGKDHSRKCIKKLFEEAGCLQLLGGENIASDAGITGALFRNPSMLMQLDEIGRILRTLTSKNAPAHLYNIPTLLTQIFSAADNVFIGKEYAGRERQDITQPNLCIYGTTVPTHFYAALTRDEVNDGFLSRCLIVQGEINPAEQEIVRADPPAEIVSALRDLVATLHGHNPLDPLANSAQFKPDTAIATMDESATLAFAELRGLVRNMRSQDRDNSAIWARTWEHAAKLALVMAVSRLEPELRIDESAARWGIDLAIYCTRTVIAAVAEHVADNATEADVKRVLRVIKAAGSLTRSALIRKTQGLKVREREDILSTLVEAKRICVERVTGKTKVTLVYHFGRRPKRNNSNNSNNSRT